MTRYEIAGTATGGASVGSPSFSGWGGRCLGAVLAMLLLAATASAQPRRMVYDNAEGARHSAWKTSGQALYPFCERVSASLDGAPVLRGAWQYACNWDGQAPTNFGHANSEQWIDPGTLPFVNEWLLRLPLRFDQNMDHKRGSKLMRPGYPSAGSLIVACEFEGGANASWWVGGGVAGSSYFSPGNSAGRPVALCGDHGPQEIAFYVRRGTNGQIKFWANGVLKATWNGDTSNVPLSLYIPSNWSISEAGWDHDKLNTFYIDEVEIYTDATSGGEVATGSLSDNTARVTGAPPPPPPPPTASLTGTSPIVNGATATLSWKSSGPGNIVPDVGPVGAEGSAQVSPKTTTTYTLTVANSAGATATHAFTVVVTDAPPPPPPPPPGQPTRLECSVIVSVTRNGDYSGGDQRWTIRARDCKEVNTGGAVATPKP